MKGYFLWEELGAGGLLVFQGLWKEAGAFVYTGHCEGAESCLLVLA